MKLISEIEERQGTYKYAMYECPTCLKPYKVRMCNVANGTTTKCRSCARKSHGMRKTRLYTIWCNMKQRCYNTKHTNYDTYGGKGVVLCKEWQEFTAFQSWASKEGYGETLTIDRKESDGIYEPSNCRWVDRTIQAQNQGKARSKSSSQYKGVSFISAISKWKAKITISGSTKYLGTFKTELEGAIAYDTYIKKHKLEHKPNGVLG